MALSQDTGNPGLELPFLYLVYERSTHLNGVSRGQLWSLSLPPACLSPSSEHLAGLTKQMAASLGPQSPVSIVAKVMLIRVESGDLTLPGPLVAKLEAALQPGA